MKKHPGKPRPGRPRKIVTRYPSGRIKYTLPEKKTANEDLDLLAYCLKKEFISQAECDAGYKLLEYRQAIFGKMDAPTSRYQEKINHESKKSFRFQIAFLNNTNQKEADYQTFADHTYFKAISELKKNGKLSFYLFEKHIIFNNFSSNLKLNVKSRENRNLINIIRTNLQILEKYFACVFSRRNKV